MKKQSVKKSENQQITNLELKSVFPVEFSRDIPDYIRTILFDNNKKNELFNQLVSFGVDLSVDFFLQSFQSLLSNRNELKQDYTPPEVSALCGAFSGKAQSVLDLCAGSGSLSIAKWNECPNAKFYCVEYSVDVIYILLFNLAIRGIEGEVIHGNALTGDVIQSFRLTKNGDFSDIEITAVDWTELKVDCVISNPPYSLPWQQVETDYTKGYPLPPKTKADYAFILRGLHYLKPTGKACFVLPHGVLFRGQAEGKIRQQLISENKIDAVIGLPNKLFYVTQIPVCLICFDNAKSSNDYLFINAKKEFVKNGKINLLQNEYIEKIKTVFLKKKDSEISKCISFDEIKNNDFNLNIPRYVPLFEKEDIPDLLTTAKELLEINQQLEQSQSVFLGMLSQLEMIGTMKEQAEFEQAKKLLHQAMKPKSLSPVIMNKLKHFQPQQADLFSDDEIQELDGFIKYQEQNIKLLQQTKKYFLSKMFPQ